MRATRGNNVEILGVEFFSLCQPVKRMKRGYSIQPWKSHDNSHARTALIIFIDNRCRRVITKRGFKIDDYDFRFIEHTCLLHICFSQRSNDAKRNRGDYTC